MFKREKNKDFDSIQGNDEKQSLLLLEESHNSKIHILPKSDMKGIVDIICGYGGTTYIVLKDNTFIIYGYNAFGQLAVGHFDYVNEPEIPRWSDSHQIRQIFSGISSKHSFIITQTHQLFAVGNNSNKQFGINTNANTLSEWTEIKINQFKIKKEEIASIATSEQYTNFLTANGQIYETVNDIKLNDNNDDILIRGIKMNILFRDIKCGKSHSLAICFNDNLFSWGSNEWGQLSNIDINQNKKINSPQTVMFFFKYNIKIKQIECGNDHSLILTKNKHNGKVFCFGRNDYYQLGNGLNNPYIVKLPELNKSLQDQHIIHIKAGGHHNMAKNNKNEYFLWGYNKQNQCLVYDGNVEFVKLPKMYQNKHQNMKIIGIYLGYKETKIVRKYKKKEEISKSSKLKGKNDRNLNKLQEKLKKFKTWCTRNKSRSNSNEITINEWTNNDLNDNKNKKKKLNNFNYFDRVDEENYYQEEEYINHQFIKHKEREEREERERENNDNYYISRKWKKMKNSVRNNHIQYHAVTVQEC